MYAVIYAFISAIIYSIENLLPRYLKRLDALDIIILRELIVLLPLTPFFITKFNYVSFSLIIVGFLLGFIPYFSFLKALKIGKIGIVVAISQTHSLFAILFSLLLFSTLPPVKYYIALILMMLSLTILYFSDYRVSTISPIIYALIAAILWGIQAVIIRHYFSFVSPWDLVYFTELGLFLASYTYALIKKKKINKPKNKKEYLILGFMSYGILIALYFYIKSLQLSEHASLPLIILTSSTILSTIWSYFLFKEKLKFKEIISIILAIAGVVVVNL